MEEEKREVIELKKSEETTNNNAEPVVELTKVEKAEEKQETASNSTPKFERISSKLISVKIFSVK